MKIGPKFKVFLECAHISGYIILVLVCLCDKDVFTLGLEDLVFSVKADVAFIAQEILFYFIDFLYL